MKFTDVLDEMSANLAGAKSIFTKEDGVSATSISNRTLSVSQLEYKRNLAEAVKLVSDVMHGRRSPYILQEVMTTSDFPLYFATIIDRTMLAKYEAWVPGWTAYAKRTTVRNFLDQKIDYPMRGLDGPLDEVAESAPYPDAALSEDAPLTWNVKKYGRRVPFSWETLINDNLNQLTDIPERLAVAARRTEHRLVTQLFVGTSGPNTSLYHNNYGNIINTTNGSPAAVGSNPPLSINGLQAALIVMSKMTDEDGNPIMREFVTLVVPPALEVTANNIVNAIAIYDSTLLGGGQPDNHSTSGERQLQTRNWLAGRMQVVVDPYIPTYASVANGNTSWFLFANPNTSREAIRIGFLTGHERPEIWMKSPNAVNVSGGAVGPMSGDFDTDSIEYRVRHVVGVTQVDPKATVMSNGSGS